MAYSPCIVFVKAEVRETMRATWEAMGRGPNSFSRKCCAIDPEATWETPATHYMMQDESATVEDEAIWRALITTQDLPELPPGVVWGENGVVSAQDVQAAATEENVNIFSRLGNLTEPQIQEWKDSAFSTMGLQFVPDEPI